MNSRPGNTGNKVLALVIRTLRERGLAIREHKIHNQVTEIEVTNPADRDRGRVVCDQRGMLTWDYLPRNLDESMAGKLADTISALLTADIPRNRLPGT